MFTRDSTLEQIRGFDRILYEACIIILDQMDIIGEVTEQEVEQYLQFYSMEIQKYRVAALTTLHIAQYLEFRGRHYYLTEKWNQSAGLDPYFLEYVDCPKQSNP